LLQLFYLASNTDGFLHRMHSGGASGFNYATMIQYGLYQSNEEENGKENEKENQNNIANDLIFFLSAWLSILLSTCLSVYFSVRLFDCLTIGLSVSHFISSYLLSSKNNIVLKNHTLSFSTSFLFVHISVRLSVSYIWSVSAKIRNAETYRIAGNPGTKITSFCVADQKLEVLNVPGAGNCFYEMFRVGLAFQNKFETVRTIKSKIFAWMKIQWDSKTDWFLTMYRANVLQIHQNDFNRYARLMRRNGEWASFLERTVATIVFKTNLLMHTPGQMIGWESTAAQIFEKYQFHFEFSSKILCAYVNAEGFFCTTLIITSFI